MANVLVIDDEASVRDVLNNALVMKDHRVTEAASGEEAVVSLRKDIFDVAIVDLRLGGMDGLDVMRVIKDVSPDTEVIMLTGYGTVDVAIEAMNLGAYDFVTKPVRMDELLLIVDRALEKKKLADSAKALRVQLKDGHRFPDIIGSTPDMLKVCELIEKACHSDSAVLIVGESGTGRELVARTIHANSSRSDKPFVCMNCADFPENLQERELFGYIKGAFAGAIRSKKGLFEETQGGTVLLNEVAEACPTVQAGLLTLLEDGEIRRVGDDTPIYVDTRLITATDKDISKMVEEKAFREDLYHIINTLQIYLPPLRERKDDIPLLAQHFVRKFSRNTGKDIRNISRKAFLLLMEYDWHGNVRELQDAIRHAVAITDGSIILPESLPLNVQSGGEEILLKGKSGKMSLYELEKAYILQVLEEYSWNYEKAAEILGIGKATISRKLKEYGIVYPNMKNTP